MKVLFTLLLAVMQFSFVVAQNVSADAGISQDSGTASYLAVVSSAGQNFTQNEAAGFYSTEPQQVRSGIFESTGNGFSMDQNSPNPCNEFTGIHYYIPAAGEIEFRIFNLIGKEVYRSLINAEQGQNEFRLDSREFTQGVYMYTMTFNGETISKRMVISRK